MAKFKTRPQKIGILHHLTIPTPQGVQFIVIGLDEEDNSVWKLDEHGDWAPWGSRLNRPDSNTTKKIINSQSFVENR